MSVSAKKSLYIGCSGYYYSSWKNKFYPARLAAKNWLAYYASVFNTVELNSSFYRKPQLKSLQKYNAITPANFRFSVKMSRYITHILRMRNCIDAVKELQDLVLGGLEEKLGCFLFQLPASFKYTEENLRNVLKVVPGSAKNVVEFRDISWWNDEVQEAFTQSNITFCNVDFPHLDTFIMSTTDNFYLRMHGNPQLFKSSYSTETLRKYSKAVPVDAKNYFVYFNNTYFEAAYQNAQELRTIMERKKLFQYA